MSHFDFRNDSQTSGNILAGYYYGNGAFLSGLGQASIPAIVHADLVGNVSSSGNITVSGQINTVGNVAGGYFIGNGSLLSGVSTSLPGKANVDIVGNVDGVYANVGSVLGDSGNIGNVVLLGGNVVVSGQINTLGNIVTGNYINANRGNIANVRIFSENISMSGQLGARGNIIGNVFLSKQLIGFPDTSQNAANLLASSSAYTSVMLEVLTARGPSSSFSFIECDVSNGGTAYAPFTVVGDGNVVSTTGFTVRDATTNVAYFVVGNTGYITATGGNIGNVLFLGGNVAVSGQINVLGNVVAGYFIGDIVGNVVSSGNITVAGQVSASGNITTTQAMYASFFSGSGSGLQNIPSTALASGPLFKDISGSIEGTFANVAEVNTTALNLTGNMSTTGAVYSAYFSGSGAGLQNIPATGLASGPLFKDISGSIEGNYANSVIVNTSLINATGNITTTGNIVASSANVASLYVSGNTVANTLFLSSPTTATNILQIGGTQVGLNNINVAGLGRNLYALRINTLTGNTIEFYAGGSMIANLSPTGNLTIAGADATKATGTAWVAASDRRLKANIVSANLELCLSVVRALDLKRFEWGPEVAAVAGDKKVLGWIAQEVEPYFPSAIKTRPAFGLDDAKLLDADQLFINTYGALKRSVEMIDDLVAQVASLTAKVNSQQ
jgi:hypothetical protein